MHQLHYTGAQKIGRRGEGESMEGRKKETKSDDKLVNPRGSSRCASEKYKHCAWSRTRDREGEFV